MAEEESETGQQGDSEKAEENHFASVLELLLSLKSLLLDYDEIADLVVDVIGGGGIITAVHVVLLMTVHLLLAWTWLLLLMRGQLKLRLVMSLMRRRRRRLLTELMLDGRVGMIEVEHRLLLADKWLLVMHCMMQLLMLMLLLALIEAVLMIHVWCFMYFYSTFLWLLLLLVGVFNVHFWPLL